MAKPNFTLPNKPAIKSGSILSYNYTDDFTFVPAPLTFNRDSAATRVNEKGLIEDVGYFGPELVQNGDFSELGPELVTNGSFDTDSNWIKQTGVTISNGAAHWDGTQTSNTRCYQVITSLVQGKQYKVVFTATITSGAIFANVKGNSSGTSRTTSGTYTETIIGGSSDNNFLLVGDDNFIGSIDNISVKEVGQNWDFTDGSTITNNVVRIVSDGTLQKITQNNILTIGKQYKIQYEIVENNFGSLKMSSSFGLNTIPSTVGVHTVYAEALLTFLSILRVSSCDITITNISIIEVLGDKPRIDYSDSLTEPSLLLEPQSTNLIAYSEYINVSVSSWTSFFGTIITNNDAISPDGKNNATKIECPIGQSARVDAIVLGLAVGTYTYSFYAKGDVSNLDVNIYQDATGDTLSTTAIETLFNDSEWSRIDITFTTTALSLIRCIHTNLTAGESFHIWGVQFEQLPYATSYIPTAGSTATRLGETANNAGDVNVFNSEEGVLYFEAKTDNTDAGSISINNGTLSVRITARVRPDISKIQMAISGSTDDFNYNSETITLSEYNKIAIVYNNGQYYFFINGVKSTIQNRGTFNANSFTQFDFNRGGGGEIFYGKVKNVKVFNKALTDKELEILTIQ